MNTRQQNFQDMYLNQLRKEKVDVTVYLTNGFQFKGQVRAFDSFTILLESEGKQQLVFKHAVSTITPKRNIDYINHEEK
ncbi:MAG: RNA chaperone Hfq [Ruminococcaceae bacterium]|nr:RNA chaperone Hfq [Oscillospiraceae bacterium]